PALERGHELHARRGLGEGDAGEPRGDLSAPRALLRHLMGEGGGHTPPRGPSVDRPPAPGPPFESIFHDPEADPVSAPASSTGSGSAPAGSRESSERGSGADGTPRPAAGARAEAASRGTGADATPRSAPGAPREISEQVSGADVSPMMRQYRDWKRRYPDYLL